MPPPARGAAPRNERASDRAPQSWDAVADEELVDRAQSGQRDALVALYRRYVNEIYGYLYNQLGDRHDAEDLTSETFLRVVRNLESFAGRSTFRTWLYEVARNQMRDHWRRGARRPATVGDVSDLAEVPEPIPEPDSDRVAFGREILEALPENYRAVVQLRILDGRTIRDTAEELGKTESNIKVLTHRALKRAVQVAESLRRMEDAENGRC